MTEELILPTGATCAGSGALQETGATDAAVVRLAQLQEIFGFGAYINIMNAIITVTVVAIYEFSSPVTSPAVLMWSCLNFVVIALRTYYQARVAEDVTPQNSQKKLLQLSVSALIGGSVWAALPHIVPHFDVSGQHSYMTLILIGVSAGALVRGVPFALMALFFATPPIFSLAVRLVEDGSPQSMILCGNAALLVIVLGRGALLAAKNFSANAITRHQAMKLAQSLQAANADIQVNNKALETLATCDALTGLANRSRFNSELSLALQGATGSHVVALFVLDLDKFKFVNDTLGHAAGDSLLIEVGKRLTAALDGHGIAARLGGDEFAVIIPGLRGPREAMALAEQCLSMICRPVILASREFMVQASLGVGIYPHHAQSVDDLFACADRALYRSKKIGRAAPAIFSADMRLTAERKSRIELDIRDALQAGHLDTWFQPQVRMSDGAMIGVEALVRWHHPELGQISPLEIVEAVHARRAHELLTAFIAERACALQCRIRQLGLGDLIMAINLSAQDFAHYDVSRTLKAILDKHGLSPNRFELEFTEDALLDPKIHGEQILELDNLGFRLALDDFGMGSTSLNYLMHMRIDRLKIDRSFVHGVAASRHSQALVTAMVALGRMLDIDILVEGVETEEDRAMLRMLGCEAGQGYLFARPMPAGQLIPWLDRRANAA